MRQWTLNRKPLQKRPEGTAMISLIRAGQPVEGDKTDAPGMMRVDIPEAEGGVELATQEAGVLGWWRWTVKSKPPTQKELNERLEQLFLSLKASTAAHKDALAWLVGLYLTRKRILRQETGGFVHVKTQEHFEVRQEAIDAVQMEAAMGELMAVIS